MTTFDPAFTKLHSMYRMWKDDRHASTMGEAESAERMLRRELDKIGMTMATFEGMIATFNARTSSRPFNPSTASADPFSGFRSSPPPRSTPPPPPIDDVEVRFTCRSKFEQDIAVELVRKYGQPTGRTRSAQSPVRIASTIIGLKVNRGQVPVVTAKWRAAKRMWAQDLEAFAASFRSNL